jgi:hypothetical protein
MSLLTAGRCIVSNLPSMTELGDKLTAIGIACIDTCVIPGRTIHIKAVRDALPKLFRNRFTWRLSRILSGDERGGRGGSGSEEEGEQGKLGKHFGLLAVWQRKACKSGVLSECGPRCCMTP